MAGIAKSEEWGRRRERTEISGDGLNKRTEKACLPQVREKGEGNNRNGEGSNIGYGKREGREG
jgi:hypothetical protein